MKFEAVAERFARCVGIAAESTSREALAFAGMRIEADAAKGRVTLRTVGGSGAALISLPAAVDESGGVSLPARLFRQIALVAAEAGGNVTVSAAADGNACEVYDDGDGFWQPRRISDDAVPASLFVSDNDENDAAPLTANLSHDVLQDLREVVSHFVSTDDKRIRLCGIETMFRSDGSLCFTATDTYQLASMDTAPESKAKTQATGIIPPVPLLTAARHIPDDESATLTVTGLESLLQFSLGDDCDAEMSVRQYQPPYPEWAPIAQPPKRPKRLHMSPQALINAVNRTVLIHQSRDGEVILEPNANGTVTVRSMHPEAGEATDVLPCSTGRGSVPENTMFNARTLIEATKHCSDEEIKWEIAPRTTQRVPGDEDDKPKSVPGRWVTVYQSPHSKAQLTIVVMPKRMQ